jgi:chondroitin 4-sulfotransferase 11
MLRLPPEFLKNWDKKYHTVIPILTRLSPLLSLQDKWNLLNNMTKMTIVRHPFVRLVSAYQDKVIDHYYKDWADQVYKLPTIHEDIKPNFEQFVDFVIDMKIPEDPHLRFFWYACDMCHVNYDIIAKTETINEDTEYIYAKVET